MSCIARRSTTAHLSATADLSKLFRKWRAAEGVTGPSAWVVWRICFGWAGTWGAEDPAGLRHQDRGVGADDHDGGPGRDRGSGGRIAGGVRGPGRPARRGLALGV